MPHQFNMKTFWQLPQQSTPTYELLTIHQIININSKIHSGWSNSTSNLPVVQDEGISKSAPSQLFICRMLGVGGYSQYLKAEFLECNEEGNQRIFYLLQSAANGGGAAHLVQKFAATANGHGAWQALLAWYEGPTISGEIA